MLRKGHYRQVFEMLKEEIMAWFSAGHEGQEKSGSVSSMISLGNFPDSRALYAPKGTKGRKFQEFCNIQSWCLSRNFVPFVPYIPQKAFGVFSTVIFPCGGGIGKVTILYAPNAPLTPGGI